MKTHGVCTLGEVLLGLLISLSFQKLDVTAEMFFNLKYCTPIISGLGGLKLNLVVGVNCLSLEPSLAGDVTVQRLHNLPFGKSCPWQPCYSCSTSASSTCTQCCWDEEDSYLWLFLLLSAALGSCLFRLCDTVAAKERGMHYCTFSWHKKGFIITLALLPLPFLLIFSTLRATRAILFHFLIPLVRLHLACPRSFWCNPTTIYSGSNRDFGALPKMLLLLLAVFSLF